MTIRVSVGELREHLSEYLSRAQYAGERVTVTRNGRPVAALITLDDLRLLQELEDRLDSTEADDALREATDALLPWTTIRPDPDVP